MSRRLFTASWTDDFLQTFSRRELVGLSWYDAGVRSFYGTEPLRSLKDLQGKTIRVQDSRIDAAENNGPAYYFMDCPE